MAQQFSLEAFIFIFILIVYVLTSHLIQVKKVLALVYSRYLICTSLELPSLWASQLPYSLNMCLMAPSSSIIKSSSPSYYRPSSSVLAIAQGSHSFFENFGMITFLGIIGTILAFITLSFFISLCNMLFDALTLQETMLLASVLCATDTVAAMSLIKPQRFPVLNAVLFGQGVINDAVAIILFRTVMDLQLDQTGGITIQIVLKMIVDFLILFVFSIAIGAASGFGLSYLLKVNESFNKYPIKQTSLIILTGYMTYLIGELLGFSGIITLFTCSIIMGHYTFMNISEESQRGTGLAFQTLSYIAEAFVYAYLGASVLGISGRWLAVGFGLLVLTFLPVVRALVVYALPLLYKCTKKTFPMNDKELKMCWYAGLVRGVIAFALCLQIDCQNKEYIITIVLVIVMLTTLVGASLLKSFSEWIGLQPEEDELKLQQYKSNLSKSLIQASDYKPINFALESGYESNKQNFGDSSNNGIKSKFEVFENEYMGPLFKRSKTQDFSYQIQVSSIPSIKETSDIKLPPIQ